MTLEALHIAGACFTSAVLAVVLVLWLLAERRREAAEQRVDALRAQAVALILRAHRLAEIADEHLNAWDAETPQAWRVDPSQERIRLAHSAIWSARETTHEGAEALRS